MKQVIKNYGFNKTTKEVTFTDFGAISLDRLLLITNVTANTVIYQFNDTALGGSTSGNVLTLAYNTSAMQNTDKLQIIYDCAAGDPLYDTALLQAQGSIASGAADTGNPIKIGGVFRSTPPTFLNGQRADLQVDASGRLLTSPAPLSEAIDTVGVRGVHAEQAGLSTASVTNNDLMPSIDVSIYKAFSLQVTGTWTGTVRVQGSNDNTTWVTIGNFIPQGSNILANDITGNNVYTGFVYSRYLRVRVITGGTGTLTGTMEFYGVAPAGIVANSQQGGTWTVQPGNTANTTAWKVEESFSFATIATATTTTVKSGSGLLRRVLVTGGVAGTVIVYDNTTASGTKIADFDTTNAIAQYQFDTAFATGLTFVTSAATKITVVYR